MNLHLRWLALAAASLTGAGCRDSDLAGPRPKVNSCEHDVTAPTVSMVSASPNRLWPPNHKMADVTIAVSASDNCSTVTSRIVEVASNEPVNALGDGDTAPDWEVTGPLTLMVRSERSGLGSGRIYTVTVTSTDVAGNATSGTTTISVPHDQGED